jgi:hypothetical protein
MGKQRQRTRIKSRIDELSEEMKNLIDARLADVNITYIEIAAELHSKGYEVSKSSIGRYALRQGAALNRLKQAQDQTKALINAVKKNPDTDYTEAGMQILMDSLVRSITMAQEAIDEMPPDKAGRLMVAISRTAIYKEKIRADLTKGYKKAIEEVKRELSDELKNEPELYTKMLSLVDRVDSKVTQQLEGD